MRLSRSDQVARRAKRGALRSKVARGRARTLTIGVFTHALPLKTPKSQRIEDSKQSSPRHLLQYVTGRAAGKRHNETPTVRKTPPLPLRPMLRTPQPPASDTARQSLPWRRGFQPRPLPRRWSFKLRHNDAAGCCVSLTSSQPS